MRFHSPLCRTLLLVLGALLIGELPVAQARSETLYMAILNSRKHRLNASDNPVVGTFISTDCGITWTHSGWREYIRTFFVAEGGDGTIWAACGNGVLRSTDRGTSWKVTTGWNVTEVLKLAVDPSDPSTVYAATAYGPVKTTDHGEHWSVCTHGLRRPFAAEVIVDRAHPSRIYAATEEGVFVSTNGARHWTRAGLNGKGVRTILQDPVEPAVLWAGTEDDGVFRSPDRGKSWTSLRAGLEHPTVYAVAVDPTQSGRVYLGTHGGGVYRSTDGGRHWTQCASGLTTPDVHTLVICPSQPEVILAGTLNGGLFRSADGAEHWTFSSQEEAQVWGLSAAPGKSAGTSAGRKP